MAISTLDGIIAGYRSPVRFGKAATPTLVAGRPHSLFYLAGNPGAAAAPTPGLSGAALTSYAGQLRFDNPAASAYLAKLYGQATIAGTLLLCDRLWHNSGITITQTSAHTINSVAFPARDIAGTIDGDGVLIGVEVSAATGAGTPTLTIGYTNTADQASRTAANIQPTAATSAIGVFHELGLQVGDTGVKSVQTFTLSATWTSGTIHLVAYRVIAELALVGPLITSALDVFGTGMPQMFSNSVPFLIFVPQTTTATQITGGLQYTHG